MLPHLFLISIAVDNECAFLMLFSSRHLPPGNDNDDVSAVFLTVDINTTAIAILVKQH